MVVVTSIDFGKGGAVLGDAYLVAVAFDRIIRYGHLTEFDGQKQGTVMFSGLED